MEPQNSYRSQISFVVSMLLHGAVIALVVLGPSFFGSKGLEVGGDKRVTVAFSAQNQPAPAAVEPAPPPPPAPEVKVAEVKPIPVKPLPVKPVSPKISAVKAAPVAKAPTKKIVAINLPEKSSVSPQEPIAAENTEEPLEKTAKSEEVTNQESAVVVAKNEAPAEPEPAPAKEPVEEDVPAVAATDAAFTSEKPVKPAAAAEKSPATKEEVPAAAQPAPLPAPVVKSTTTGSNTNAPADANGTANSIAAASAASGVAVTQSYTGLKQVPGNKPPAYTREMRLQKLQGAGQLVYFVNKDGSISQLQVTKSTGVASLDKAAVDAFSKYRFVPGQEGFTVHNFEFSLKGPAISDSGRLRTSMK